MQRVLFPPRGAFLTGLAVALAFAMPRIEAAPPSEAVRRAEERRSTASATRDVETFRRMLLPEVRSVSTGPLLKGADVVVRAWSEYFDPDSDKALLWTPETVTVANSEDLAFSTGVFQVVGTAGGSTEILREDRYVTVWRFVNGAWRVAADALLFPLEEGKLEFKIQAEKRPPRMILQGPNATAARAIRLYPSGDGKLAYAVGEYRAPSGPAGSGARYGVFLAVWERQGIAGWRLVASSFPEPH
jgi:ketosteroid isomerase-like protein